MLEFLSYQSRTIIFLLIYRIDGDDPQSQSKNYQ